MEGLKALPANTINIYLKLSCNLTLHCKMATKSKTIYRVDASQVFNLFLLKFTFSFLN